MTTLSRRKILKSGALVTLSIALPTGNSLQARGQKMRVQTNDPLLSLSLNESAALIRSKALSAVELTEAVISGAEQLSSLHAYITFEPEFLRRQARAADQAVKQGSQARAITWRTRYPQRQHQHRAATYQRRHARPQRQCSGYRRPGCCTPVCGRGFTGREGQHA